MNNQELYNLAKSKGYGATIDQDAKAVRIYLWKRAITVQEVAFELDIPEELFFQSERVVGIHGVDA